MNRTRIWIGAAVAAAAIAVFVFVPPVRQNPADHHFADARTLLGIPNFWNVASNVAFAAVGMTGLRSLRRMRAGWQRTALVVMFTGVALTAVGSAWYHLAPGDATLVWDRLPMTMVFTPLIALLLGERRALWPLLAAGVASIVYWQVSGDLRLYGLVQFLPMVMIPALLLMLPDRYAPARDLWTAFAWYGAAKIFELMDARIFAAGGVVSGHTLKHLAAACACWWLLKYFAARLGGYACPRTRGPVSPTEQGQPAWIHARPAPGSRIRYHIRPAPRSSIRRSGDSC